jgi:hypothetical protein
MYIYIKIDYKKIHDLYHFDMDSDAATCLFVPPYFHSIVIMITTKLSPCPWWCHFHYCCWDFFFVAVIIAGNNSYIVTVRLTLELLWFSVTTGLLSYIQEVPLPLLYFPDATVLVQIYILPPLLLAASLSLPLSLALLLSIYRNWHYQCNFCLILFTLHITFTWSLAYL